MILDPRGPQIQTLTQFQDVITINVDIKADGKAGITVDGKRLVYGFGKQPAAVPLDKMPQLVATLEAFNMLCINVLGEGHSFNRGVELMRGQLIAELNLLNAPSEIAEPE